MPLRYELNDAIAAITLHRPEVLNAFDDELGREMVAAVQRAAEDPAVRCVVITGAGRAFSSGEDLAALAEGYERGEVPELGRTLVDRYNPLVRAIRGAPKPVIAAVNGVAAGAGASLALACDWRVASERAKLTLAFVKVGLIPDSGALWFLTQIVGAAKAWELAVTGQVVSAEEALRLGIYNQVLPEETFEAGWREVAQTFAVGPTRAYALAKSLTQAASERSLDDQLELEVQAQTDAGRSADHLEGVQAFLTKRPPEFHGR